MVRIIEGLYLRLLFMRTQLRSAPWLLVFLASVCTGSAYADPQWLTVLGDPTKPAVDTVEVDAASAVTFGKARLVGIRVNRARDRVARDKQVFRSYVSMVIIDCDKRTAKHSSQTLFSEALWTGTPRSYTWVSQVQGSGFVPRVPMVRPSESKRKMMLSAASTYQRLPEASKRRV